MAFTNTFEDIVISEGELTRANVLGRVECDLSFKFGAQLKSLKDVKQGLVMQARALGANAIQNFTYGQKHRWLAVDDVAFYGSGIAVSIPQDEYDKYFA